MSMVAGKRAGVLRGPSKKNKAAEPGQVPAEQEPTNEYKLTDEQVYALLASQYRPQFERSLLAKQDAAAAARKATADHRVACKQIISEMGPDAVDKIMDMIALDEDGGEEKMRKRMAREMWVAKWKGAALGEQLSWITEPDRRPAEQVAGELGKADGLAGNAFDPSRYGQGTAQLAAYEKAFYEGQETRLRAKIRPLETPPPIGDTAPTFTDAEEELETA
jgi:hypothetical protein